MVYIDSMSAGWTIACLLLIASGVYMAMLAVRVGKFAPNWLGRSFGALAAGIAIWSVGYGFELLAADLPGKMFWAKVQYLGIVSTPASWLFVALAYSRRERWLSGRLIVLLGIVPAITLALVWTNQLHGLIWSRVATLPVSTQSVLDVDYGPMFWVGATYAYVLMLAATLLMAKELVDTPALFRSQRIILLVAAGCPWFGNVLHLVRIGWLSGIDPTPFGFWVSAVAVAYGLHRRRLVELAPMARRAVFGFMDAGAIILDLEGRVLDLNPAAEGILGPPRTSVVGRPVGTWLPDAVDMLHPPSTQRAGYATVTHDSGTTSHYESRLYPIRGVDESSIIARLLILDEVTQQVEALEALEQTQKRFEELVESIPGIVWEVQIDPLRHTFVSNQAEKLLGYPTAEWLADPSFWSDHIHPDDRDWARDFGRRMERAGRPHELEYRMIHADGTAVWFRDIVDAPLPGMNLLRGISVDITERKRLEQQLQQLDRLEAIDRLAAGIAHDFNNLLTAISMYGQLAADSLEPTHPAHAEVGEITAACDRAADLARRFLVADRDEIRRPRPVLLNDVVLQLEPMLRRLLGEGTTLRMQLAADLYQVNIDPAQVEQVVMNLATNAQHAMPGGGCLTIATVNVKLDSAVPVSGPGIEAGSYAVLRVTDTGEGMSAERQARIFEPFFTTKPIDVGTGLGLATVDRVMRQTGGHIDVVSTLGEGATFELYFPAMSQIAESPSLRALRMHSTRRDR